MIPAAGGALRIGCVQYLNARPLIHGWSKPVEFDYPSALCRRLSEGALDVALVSSFEFLRDPIYSIVDQVAIASDGPVYSVILAHAGELEELDEIILDPASQTSVNLLRCLLAERRLNPRFISFSPEGENEINPGRARLLIGDQAIRFRQQNENAFEFWDLGAAWKKSTGLPFVFALWLIRPEVPSARAVADQLRATRDRNLASLDDLIVANPDFSPEFCARYFRDFLRFGFGQREQEGLLRFRSLCERHLILPQNPTPLRLV